jgi:hypothetical protein
MKIIFLCGSIEPGKDGVGDYTRRLAGELIRQGHSCGIIAIMDKGVITTVEEVQESGITNVSVLRLPYSSGYNRNCTDAKPWMDAFNPDWISLQYVPFSFHSRGLAFGLGKAIKQLTIGRKVHMMFHELWVGMNSESSVKVKVWGIVQRIMILSFTKNVNPSSVHTQTKLYQWQLSKLGLYSKLLPLFSNIEVFDSNIKINNSNKFCFVLFGSIHSGAPIESFANSICEYTKKSGVVIEIVFIGRCGEEIQQWVSTCKSKKIKIEVLGELSSVEISEVLSKADIGITTTPFLLAEKSGTVAAMKEHGLPILCVSRAWNVKGFQFDYSAIGIQLFEEEDLANYITNKSESKVVNSLSEISNQFLDSLLNFK